MRTNEGKKRLFKVRVEAERLKVMLVLINLQAQVKEFFLGEGVLLRNGVTDW